MKKWEMEFVTDFTNRTLSMLQGRSKEFQVGYWCAMGTFMEAIDEADKVCTRRGLQMPRSTSKVLESKRRRKDGR